MQVLMARLSSQQSLIFVNVSSITQNSSYISSHMGCLPLPAPFCIVPGSVCKTNGKLKVFLLFEKSRHADAQRLKSGYFFAFL